MARISQSLRHFIRDRARQRCEYCLYPEALSYFAFEIEHIISEKHGGVTAPDNLALACPFCNRFKGTDLGSLDPETGQLTPFFNPRLQKWTEHFRIEDGYIIPFTPEGRVTVLIFQFNHPDRLIERRRLLSSGWPYLPPE